MRELARWKELPLALPEDIFDQDDADMSLNELGPGSTASASPLVMNDPVLRAARRELRWFHSVLHGRVPTVGDVPADEVAAASRIAGWLSGLEPVHRGAFLVRYDGRRWPVRLTKQFGGLTSVVVRHAAMRRPRGPTETIAQAEHAAVRDLLALIVEAHRPPGLNRPGPSPSAHRKELGSLRRGAQNYVRRAESAYLDARGMAPCAELSRSREGA
jgi:hypothetical protein